MTDANALMDGLRLVLAAVDKGDLSADDALAEIRGELAEKVDPTPVDRPRDPTSETPPEPEPPAPIVPTCPSCGAVLPETPVIAQLVICPACLRSVVLEDPPRLALAEDTVNLSLMALSALRGARKHARANPQ